MVFVGLTWRAIRDLEQIERYSVDRWGARVAEEYQRSIEQALDQIRARQNHYVSEELFLHTSAYTAFASTFWFASFGRTAFTF